jgi:hypothetical protein
MSQNCHESVTKCHESVTKCHKGVTRVSPGVTRASLEVTRTLPGRSRLLPRSRTGPAPVGRNARPSSGRLVRPRLLAHHQHLLQALLAQLSCRVTCRGLPCPPCVPLVTLASMGLHRRCTLSCRLLVIRASAGETVPGKEMYYDTDGNGWDMDGLASDIEVAKGEAHERTANTN